MLASNVLGSRLQSLFDVVERAQLPPSLHRYDRVWDCCCDHGYLGIEIVREALCEKLIFVDQVPHITQQLRTNLACFSEDDSKNGCSENGYDILTCDASALCLDSNLNHLVILAGVSGRSVLMIMQALLQNHKTGQIDFLLCPTKSLYDVREYLVENQFYLLYESIVTEKKRQYEVIHVRSPGSRGQKQNELRAISYTGEMWCGDNPEHRRYLAKLIAHYQRESGGEGRERAKTIFQRYSAAMECLNA